MCHVQGIRLKNKLVELKKDDGVLCDGGAQRQYGRGRFRKEMGDVSVGEELRIAPLLSGELKSLRIYNRYLRTSKAIANFHAGL